MRTLLVYTATRRVTRLSRLFRTVLIMIHVAFIANLHPIYTAVTHQPSLLDWSLVAR